MRLPVVLPRLIALAAAAALAAAGAPARLVAQPGTLTNVPQQQRIVVPGVVGLQMQEATAVLARAGIKVASVDSITSTQQQPGTVLRQTPAAQSVVPAGTTATLLIVASPQQQQQPEEPTRQEPQGISVPNVVGQPVLVASGVLLARGLRVASVDTVPSSTARPGTVVEQEPAAGSSVARRTGVRLTIAGARPATVPDLAGLTPERARVVLEQSRLRLGPVDSVPAGDGGGTIVRQRPAAGAEAQPGARVSVSVAVAQLVAVPTLDGLTPERARATLERARLRLAGQDTMRVDGGSGTVVRQSPAAGAEVRPGSGVTVTLAVADVATVPDLSGLTLDRARAAVQSARLRIADVDSVERDGGGRTVVGQSPADGSRVRPGSGVSLDVAVPRLVAVPSLVGMRVDRARSAADAAGLDLRPRQPAAPDTAFTVRTQSPAAGTRARPGTDVVVALEQIPQPEPQPDTTPAPASTVAVPDVTGRTLAEARDTLAAYGLAAQVAGGATDGDAAADGRVASQSPAVGAQAAPGSVVALSMEPDQAVVVPPAGPTGGPTDGRDPPPPPAQTGGDPSSPSPLPWIIAALVVAAAGAGVWVMRRRSAAGAGKPAPKPATVPVPPMLRVAPRWDPGAPSVEVAGAAGGLLVMPEVRLAVHGADGEGTVFVGEGALVLNEERSHA